MVENSILTINTYFMVYALHYHRLMLKLISTYGNNGIALFNL